MADNDKAKEVASRVSGQIRNLENEINSRSSAPPDPGIAAQFDAIQAALEQIKSGEYSGEGAESARQQQERERSSDEEGTSKAKKK